MWPREADREICRLAGQRDFEPFPVELVLALDPDHYRVLTIFRYFTEVAASAASSRAHFVER